MARRTWGSRAETWWRSRVGRCARCWISVSGAVVMAPHLGVADIIVDLVSTGSTLKVNGLVEVATVLESAALLIARADVVTADTYRRSVNELVAAVESVLRAQHKRYLMANVPRRALAELKRILPGITGPTIVDVLDGAGFVPAPWGVGQRGNFPP